MSSHFQAMHFAETEGKRLLQSAWVYDRFMSTPNERLRQAREKHFESAADAARALGMSYGTYSGHENGHRGFPAKQAPFYARRFKVSAEWLLYGTGQEDVAGPELTEDVLEQMLELAMREVKVGASLGDWPRIVASSLHAQIEQLERAHVPTDR